MIKVKFYTNEQCPYCSSIEQNLIIAKFMLNKFCLFQIEKITENNPNVPRLEFWNEEKIISELAGFPFIDKPNFQNLVVLRYLLMGIYHASGIKRIEKLCYEIDKFYKGEDTNAKLV